ncbi:hypothetical protein [Catellatospora tritici]|uniref:hypothetical protein n=1 Tax=Catellatospora tritici TaxID=2851566 RepID=UPI001C2DAA71|nr:hypothetical protein [Catellatospora tritici]MBV1856416.1 hypothetical protein [Catellatospora tritici]
MIVATVLATLLCILPLFTRGAVSSPFSWHSGQSDWQVPAGLPAPTAEPATPSSTPTGTATPTPHTASPTPRPTPAATESGPVLLGPADGAGVKDLASQYCERHVSGGAARPRADGRWRCDRLLLLAVVVDMDVACRDAYGSGAYAQTSDAKNPNAWRCYRR